ncbi:hypothetical protein YC2023_114357 [Brassica napus]
MKDDVAKNKFSKQFLKNYMSSLIIYLAKSSLCDTSYFYVIRFWQKKKFKPESSSSKVKVSKLHKRKHQITALFMDMKHKETELAERRLKGLLTKADTQAKYGW